MAQVGGGRRASRQNPRADGGEEEEDEEEEETHPSFMSGLSGFFKSSRHALKKVPDAPVPRDMEPKIDRNWNDVNRQTVPRARGCIPEEQLKVITCIRFRTTPKGGYEPQFKIQCGAVEYDSRDMCTSTSYKNEAVISLEMPPCPVIDETWICFYQKNSFNKKTKLLAFWFHTSFIQDNLLVLDKEMLDKAVKDKKHKRFHPEFKVEVVFEDAPEGTTDPRAPRMDAI